MFDALWRYDLDSQNTIMFGEVSLPGSADSSSCSWKYSPMTYLQVQIPWHVENHAVSEEFPLEAPD